MLSLYDGNKTGQLFTKGRRTCHISRGQVPARCSGALGSRLTPYEMRSGLRKSGLVFALTFFATCRHFCRSRHHLIIVLVCVTTLTVQTIFTYWVCTLRALSRTVLGLVTEQICTIERDFFKLLYTSINYTEMIKLS